MKTNVLSLNRQIPKGLLAILTELADLFAHYGVQKNISTDASIIHFLNLPDHKQQEIEADLKSYLNLLVAAQTENINITKSKHLLEFALKKLSILAPKDFMDKITDENLVEIYDLEGIQIFRNMNFYRYCGYTLLELAAYDWIDLYERCHTIKEQMMKDVSSALTQDLHIHRMQTIPHLMREKFSSTKQVNLVTFQYIAPTYQSPGKKAGFVVSSNAELAIEDSTSDKIDFI